MPKRLIDGEAIWASQKLKKVSVKYRGHFQAILPLAEANGVFEADPELVWSRVFSFNRPDVVVEDVIQFMDEFENAGMIFRWQQDDKTYAIFNGINKTGRLPVESHLKRYKNLPPNPPQNLSRIVPDSPGTCPEGLVWFGKDMVRYGFDEPKEENMAIKARIKKLASTKLGWLGKINDWEAAELNQLALAYRGEQELVLKFYDWVEEENPVASENTIREFIKYAKDNIDNYRETKDLVDERLNPLLAKIVTISDQSPAGRSKIAARNLLKIYSPEEIISAFLEDYANRDEFRSKFAVREFFELGGGEAVILSIRERRIKESAVKELLLRESQRRTEEVERDFENIRKAEEIARQDLEDFFGKPKTAITTN